MNKQKILKSPIFVTVLCVVASLFVYFNFVTPIFFNHDKGDILPENSENSENSEISENSENSENSNLNAGSFPDISSLDINNSKDLLKIDMLKKVGWKRTGSRDPFSNVKRKNSKDTVATLLKNNSSIPSSSINPQTKVVHSSLPLLRAISIGSHEKIALFGTREFREGDRFVLGKILKIEPDHVLIEGSYGKRMIHLNK